jgi:hypothetical protein
VRRWRGGWVGGSNGTGQAAEKRDAEAARRRRRSRRRVARRWCRSRGRRRFKEDMREARARRGGATEIGGVSCHVAAGGGERPDGVAGVGSRTSCVR